MKSKLHTIVAACAGIFFVQANAPGSELSDEVAELKRLLAEKEAELAKEQGTVLPTAQVAPAITSNDSGVDAFIDFARKQRFILRRSIQDSTLIADPAEFQYTQPGNGDDSYAIDVGMSLSLTPDTENLYFGPAFEYHKNTLIDGGKDGWAAGLKIIHSQVDGSPETRGRNRGGGQKDLILKPVDDLLHHIYSTVLFKNDQLHAEEAYFTELNYSPVIPKILLGHRNELFGLSGIEFSFTPTIGIQYEHAGNVDETGLSGDALRFKTGLEFEVLPFSKFLNGRLQLRGSYNYWDRFADSGAYTLRDDSFGYFSGSADFYLDKLNRDDPNDEYNYGIGITYRDGDNPQEAVFDEQVWTLSLKVKF